MNKLSYYSPLPLVVYPDERLRRKCELVEEKEFGSQELLDMVGRMKETLKTFSGLGLAAPQVGINKQIFVMTEGQVIINPSVVLINGEVESEEGCLSIPGYISKVKRSADIRIVYRDEHGQHLDAHASGTHAIVIQHEIEHLYGTLFIDHLSRLKQTKVAPRVRKYLRKHINYGKVA